MSAYSLWIGPYVRCSARTKPRKRMVNTCSGADCRFWRKGESSGNDVNFCPKCGAPAVKVEVEVPGLIAEVHSGELAEKMDRLRRFNAEYEDASAPLFVPNLCNNALPRAMNVDAKYDMPTGEIMPMSGDAVNDDERAWLQATFRDELTMLRETYGKENVGIRWGVLGEIQ